MGGDGAYTGFVGIDFGTATSGFSFLALGEERPLCHYEYPDGANQYPKGRTALLYKTGGDGRAVGGQPVAWGDSAFAQYQRLQPEERDRHVYLESFKLALAPEGNQYSDLPTLTLVGLTPERVIADYLRCLVRYAKGTINKRFPTWDFGAGTRWALTVPAGWGDGAKALMRRAAAAAGIVSSENSPNLLIVHEPEAAALACQARRDVSLNVGDTFLVVDAGGGTIDITWHVVQSRGGRITLEDATHREGTTYGGRRLDDEFSQLVAASLGATYTDWKANPKSAGQYMTFIDRDWCLDVKHKFDGNYAKPFFAVPLPASLAKKIDADVLDLFERECGYDDKFPLKAAYVEKMFDRLVREITTKLDGMIGRMGGKPPNKVLMVGGLGSSPYIAAALRRHLSTRFGTTIEVVTPGYAHAAIVEGAALYAKSPGTISARKSMLTYGIRTGGAFVEGESPEAHRQVIDGRSRCSNFFDVYVKKDQLVEVGQTVERTYSPSNDGDAVSIDIYATALPPPKYCYQIEDRPQPLATVESAIDRETLRRIGKDEYKLLVKVLVGTAELTVQATDKQTGKSAATTVTFSSSPAPVLAAPVVRPAAPARAVRQPHAAMRKAQSVRAAALQAGRWI